MEALALKPLLEPDDRALLDDFWTLREGTSAGFSDIGKIAMVDIKTMHETRFWEEVEYPFEDYFVLMRMLDKTLRVWHDEHQPKT